ncbi:MAG: hypothetical protein J6V92_03255, partial [Bacteroidaceae bacterium]|nr:hypothetical protein [Bacteroidaceae bacterium]
LKRFRLEATNRIQNFLNEVPAENLLLVTDTAYPRLLVTLGGVDSFRDPFEVDGESFVGIKSFKAIGKRITTLHIGKVEELEPIKTPPISPEDGEDMQDGDEVSPSEEDIEVPEITEETDGTEESNGPEETDGTLDPYEGKSQQDIEDEMNGQLRLDF